MAHGALEHVVAAAGELDPALDVNDAQFRPELHVVLEREVEFGHFALMAQDDVLGIVLAERDLRRGRLGDQQHLLAKLGLKLLNQVGKLLAAGLELRHLGHRLLLGGGVLELGDVLARGILGGADFLNFLLGLEHPRVQFQQGGNVHRDVLVPGRLDELFRFGTNQLDVDHGLPRPDILPVKRAGGNRVEFASRSLCCAAVGGELVGDELFECLAGFHRRECVGEYAEPSFKLRKRTACKPIHAATICESADQAMRGWPPLPRAPEPPSATTFAIRAWCFTG